MPEVKVTIDIDALDDSEKRKLAIAIMESLPPYEVDEEEDTKLFEAIIEWNDYWKEDEA